MNSLARSTRRIGLLMVSALALSLVAACTDDDEPAVSTDMTASPSMSTETPPVATLGDIAIFDAWARATPGIADENSAAYMRIRNTGEPDRLVGAAWDGGPVREVQLHETVMDGGSMQMREVPAGWEIPAEGTLELARGGNHVMLIGLSEQLEPGDTVHLTLVFERAGELTFDVPVREATDASSGMSGGGDMGSATATPTMSGN